MGVGKIDTALDFLRCGVTETLSWDLDGNLFLTPNNFFSNQYLQDVDPDREPVAWALRAGMPEKIVGYHFNVSRPGSPKKASVTRQTTSPVPAEESSWKQDGPILSGMRAAANDPRKPVPPILDKVPVAVRGFEVGTYGWAWGVSSANGPTTVTAVRYFTLQNNQYPKLPVPEYFSPGTVTWDLYVTKRGGGDSTLALQRSVPVNELQKGGEYKLFGPWRNRGKPPSENRSGLGRPPKPTNADAKLVPSRRDMRAGLWTPYAQLKNDRGPGLLSLAGRPVRVKGKTERRVKETTEPVAQGFARPMASPDPRNIRPSGKLEGNYLGEENDFEESRLIALLNERRREAGVSDLIVSQVMNRAAYSYATYSEPDEPEISVLTDIDSADDALAKLSHPALADPRYRAVGVAREWAGSAYVWVVTLSEPIEDASYDAEELVCEVVRPDGTTTTHSLDPRHTEAGGDDARVAVDLSFHLVSNGAVRYRYSGSYSGHVHTAARRIHDVGSVSVLSVSSGVTVAISDGSLPEGIYARTHQDGRMILNGYYFSKATANANNCCVGHEFLHCAGLGHTDNPSMLNPVINLSVSTNHETPTSYDRSELKRRWGTRTTGTGSPGGGGSDPDPNAPSPEETQEEIRNNEINRRHEITGGQWNGVEDPENPPEEEEPPDPPPVEYETYEGAYKPNRGILCRPPALARKKDVDYTYWFFYEPEVGTGTWYRAYERKGDKAAYFGGDTGPGITVHGYPPEEEPRGLAISLVEEEPPTTDLSVLEAPDPTTVPDAPVPDGQESPPAGQYLVTIAGVTETGKLTQESEPGRDPVTGAIGVTIAVGETFRASPVKTVNVLPNPEFSLMGAAPAPGEPAPPEEWIPVNTASNQPGFFRVNAGVLTLGTTSATSLAPSVPSRQISVDPSKPLTVSGTIGATRIASGLLRIALAQLGEDLQPVAPDVILYDLPQTGEASFARTFNAGGTSLNPATAFVRLRPQVAFPSGGNAANAEGYFKDLRVLRYPTDVRKFSLDNGVADFSPLPLTPLTGDAYAVVGPAPENQPTVVDAEPPIELASFDSGDWNPGWEQILSTGTTSAVVPVPPGVPLHGSHAWRVSDPTTGVPVVAYRQKTHVLSGGDLSFRFLCYVDGVMPVYGRVRIASVRGAGGSPIADVLLGANGALVLQTFTADGRVLVEGQVAYGINAGALVDVEIGVSGGGTKDGTATCSVGLNGSPRTVPINLGRMDLSNRFPRLTRIGLLGESDARAKCALMFDQLVVTRRGDVLDRERPAPPANYTPPPPDMPVKATVARRYDGDGERINQLVVFLPTGSAPPDKPAVLPLLDRPIAVKPGMDYTTAIFSRWITFASGGNSAPGIRVWLEGDGVAPVLAASVKPMTDSRGWHPTGEEDDHVTFSVPPYEEGKPFYSRARYECVLTDGYYLFQEPLHAQGSYPLFSERDAKRGYGRATNGEIVATLPTHPEAWRLSPGVGIFWSEFGVSLASDVNASLDPNDGVEVFFSTSKDGVYFGPEEADKELILPAPFLRMRTTLAGDGRDGPAIPSGGIHLSTWSPAGVLLRRDGSHFPGVAYVSENVYATNYPDTEMARVAGHHQTVELTEEIGRLYDLVIGVNTEAAAQEIDALSTREPFVLELPKAEGTVPGMAYLVRFRSQTGFEGSGRILVRGGYREFHRTAKIEEAEVLEAAPLKGPQGLVLGASA